MRKSLRSQDKSIYLAFALSPSIVFQSIFDNEQSQDRQFHFQLSKGTLLSMEGTQMIEKTASFGTESMRHPFEMYLYLALPQYAQKLHENYAIKLVEQSQSEPQVLYQEQINLEHYIHEHNTQEKDFWTQILKHSTETLNLTIMQRVFLKRTRFQLDDIINSSQVGEQLDVVDIPATDIKMSKIAIKKSQSLQMSLNSLISPRRLDTISEEDSTVPFTERKDRQSPLGVSKHRPQRLSASVRKQQVLGDFQNQLKKQSTWVQQKNHHFDEEFFNAFEFKDHQNYKKSLRDFQSNPPSDHDQLKLKPLTQSQISQKGSKISKHTKDSQKQNDDNSISFLQKSSLLLDMSQSQLSISPDDQVCFKIKWVVLVVIILVLAVVASLSTDAFDITDNKRHKAKRLKRKADKHRAKGKQVKGYLAKDKKDAHV